MFEHQRQIDLALDDDVAPQLDPCRAVDLQGAQAEAADAGAVGTDDYPMQVGLRRAGEGLVPVSRLGQRVPESYTIIDGTLTLVPTPTYSTTRRLWYQAIHVLDSNDEYPSMDEQWASVMMIKARSLALSRTAGSLAQDSQGLESYRIGDVQVDKGKAIERYRKESADLHQEYLRAIKDAIGVQGSRATYGWADVDRLL